MTRFVNRRRILTSLATVALVVGVWLVLGDVRVRAQLTWPSAAMRIQPIIHWFGPYAITPNDTTRFNYTNLGSDLVWINWEFSNALSGEPVCGNFGKDPTPVPPGKGATWDF